MVDQLISGRSSRVVAFTRVMLALFLLMSVTLGELSAARAQHVAQAILAAYFAYSLVILGCLRTVRVRRHLFRAALALLMFDALVLFALLYGTQSPNSPFFSPLIFVILSATVQWGSRGAIWSGLMVAAVFVPSGLLNIALRPARGDVLQLFLVRIGYIGVISVTLAAFARHLERMMQELARLARHIPVHDRDGEIPLDDCLIHAVRVFDAHRGRMLWQDPEEPFLSVVEIDDGVMTRRNLPSVDNDTLVSPALMGACFLYDRLRGTTLYRTGKGLADASGQAFHPVLERMDDYDRALVIPVPTSGADGLMMILDPADPANEDLTIAAMVGAQAALTIEAWQLHSERRLAAAGEERARLARDIHDGVLQFLAGSRLQLDLIARSDLTDDARARVRQMHDAIGEEQRQLRSVVQAMKRVRSGGTTRLAKALEQVASHLARSWDARVTASVAPEDLRVPGDVEENLVRIAREAVANAVRHGGASAISIEVRQDREGLAMTIEDDGHGFPFEGSMSHAELASFAGRPRSLFERVSAMGGRLTLASSGDGVRLGITLPARGVA